MILREHLRKLIDILPNSSKTTEFPTGIKRVDDKIWFKRGEMLIVAARPSNCKSTFAWNNIALSAARNDKIVYYFSLEDSGVKFTTRHLANQLSIDSGDIIRNNLNEHQLKRISDYAQTIDDLGIFIFENTGFDFESMTRKVADFSTFYKKKPDVIIVDYINKISIGNLSRYEAVTQYSHKFTQWIKQNDVLGILVCQIGRDAQGEGNGKKILPPQLHHLRDSGALEQDAQGVLILHYDYKYTGSQDDKYNIWVNVAKNKDGDTGAVKCNINPEFNRIVEAVL